MILHVQAQDPHTDPDVPFFSSLSPAGREGECLIGHEHRGFEGSDELVKRGFIIARDVLPPWCH